MQVMVVVDGRLVRSSYLIMGMPVIAEVILTSTYRKNY
jgi:hypothetical protein